MSSKTKQRTLLSTSLTYLSQVWFRMLMAFLQRSLIDLRSTLKRCIN
jgi:hypothetical protein